VVESSGEFDLFSNSLIRLIPCCKEMAWKALEFLMSGAVDSLLALKQLFPMRDWTLAYRRLPNISFFYCKT
jgi:hypothetical protein